MEDHEDELVIAGSRYRRHTNPDGTQGGWVGTEAHVASTAYIGKEAMVDDGGHVEGRARLLGKSRVYGGNTVEGDVVLCDQAAVSGLGCRVKGSAVLSGRSGTMGYEHVVEGYTHLHDISIEGRGMVISGGEFTGNPTSVGASQLILRYRREPPRCRRTPSCHKPPAPGRQKHGGFAGF